MVDGQMRTEHGSSSLVISVVSPKGGVGRTMIASNLATVIAREAPTVLIDGDTYCGDVEFALGLRPVYRLDDMVLQSSVQPDLDVASMLTRAGGSLSVLCAPKNPFMADQLESRATWNLIERIMDATPMVVIDNGPGISPLTIPGLDIATRILLVAGTDTASVNAARTMLGVMDQLSMDRRLVRLVVNRPAPRTGLRVGDVEEILAMTATCVIADDAAVTTSMNSGTPIVDSSPKSAAARSLVSLASSIRAALPGDEGLETGGEP